MPASHFKCQYAGSLPSYICLPDAAGRELDLRKLYDAVQQSGGYEAAVANKKFGRIAAKLAIDISAATNAAYLLK